MKIALISKTKKGIGKINPMSFFVKKSAIIDMQVIKQEHEKRNICIYSNVNS